MTRAAKIILGLLGTAIVVGGGAAAVMSGGDKPPDKNLPPPDEEPPPPKQDEALERPGYKILPNCGGFEITDKAAALKYARDLVGTVPAAGWDQAVALELYGPVCNMLPTDEFKAVMKVAGNFLYSMTRAVLQGAITHGYYNDAQAEEALQKTRETFAQYGVSQDELKPTTVWG